MPKPSQNHPKTIPQTSQNHLKIIPKSNKNRLPVTIQGTSFVRPINYVENIRGDLFVIHGRQDRQASYKQVLQLKEALEDADIPFEYMIKGDEGHGFYSETNNLELYSKMIDFLDASLNN